MAVARKDLAGDVESVILSLRDVLSARVVLDSTGEISEVHVLTEALRTPKQVVRDIESGLMAKLGMSLDHRKVSVAQVQGGAKRDSVRLRFSDVSISFDGSRAEASVRLMKGDTVYTGSSSGIDSSMSQMKLVATATLRAVENAGAADGTMAVEDMTTSVSLAGKTIVAVLINMITDRGEDYLTGSAMVKKDLWKAVVNATLDAVNRRIGLATED